MQLIAVEKPNGGQEWAVERWIGQTGRREEGGGEGSSRELRPKRDGVLEKIVKLTFVE